MDFIDYYQALGISKTATEDEIKKAYRKLARKLHPDLNPGDKDAGKKFQQINEANEVLSDPEKRKKYDQYGKDWQHAEQFEKAGQSRQQSRGQTGGFDAEDFGEGGFSSFFDSMFGGGEGRRSRQTKFRGQDYNSELRLSLIDAYTTHKQTLTINGKNVRISIPAGIENGQIIKLSGYGAPGINGGPNGDLYISFSIENDARYKRSGNDLYVTEELELYTAVLGGDITVDTLSGLLKLKVNPETQNGTKTRLKGKGFPVYKKEGQFGDLYITYHVKIPTNLTEKQKELFKELSATNI
ncbi:MAG: J domain-containing protein [Ferruginibacter sp.]